MTGLRWRFDDRLRWTWRGANAICRACARIEGCIWDRDRASEPLLSSESGSIIAPCCFRRASQKSASKGVWASGCKLQSGKSSLVQKNRSTIQEAVPDPRNLRSYAITVNFQRLWSSARDVLPATRDKPFAELYIKRLMRILFDFDFAPRRDQEMTASVCEADVWIFRAANRLPSIPGEVTKFRSDATVVINSFKKFPDEHVTCVLGTAKDKSGKIQFAIESVKATMDFSLRSNGRPSFS